jgi:phosphoglycolate phosphatase
MDLLIFDLDGTLIDSKLDLAISVNAARAHMGLPPLANSTVYSYVGNGAPVLLRRVMGSAASEADVQRALEYFQAHYREHLLVHTCLYPGVREALDAFRAARVPMAVLTNKPAWHSQAIVRGLGIDSYFLHVYGGDSFPEKKPHPMGVDSLREELGAARERTWMIGDSGVDIRTARNAGIRACGVTYGFLPETLNDEPPDLLLDSLALLPERLLAD